MSGESGFSAFLQVLDLPAQWIAEAGATAAGVFACRAWREQE
jgi:hypothetical protein